jgi:hypothetical protein
MGRDSSDERFLRFLRPNAINDRKAYAVPVIEGGRIGPDQDNRRPGIGADNRELAGLPEDCINHPWRRAVVRIVSRISVPDVSLR